MNLVEKIGELFDNLSDYGAIIFQSLVVLMAGVIVVLALQWLATKYVFPRVKRRRVLRVLFGTMYALVAVASILLALDSLGYDAKPVAKLALVVVLTGALVSVLLSPYMPSLPFKLGHTVEIDGVVGRVDTITPFHTRIQTLDGKSIFFPNTRILYTSIINYDFTPNRRIELNGVIDHAADLQSAIEMMLEVMGSDPRVLPEPPPKVMIRDVSLQGITFGALCWVENADWIPVKSELWKKLLAAFAKQEGLSLALPKQEVHLIKEQTSG